MSATQKFSTGKLHCKIDEAVFSRALFLCRLFTGSALLYVAMGSLLYWREFLVNTALWGFPSAVSVSFGLSGTQLLLGLLLMLGWHARIAACLAFPISLLCAAVFFLGQFNNIAVAWCLLLGACLSVIALLGPGTISLDYKRSQQAANRFLRG